MIKKKKLLSWLFYSAYFFIVLADMFTQVKFINHYLGYLEYISIALLFTVFLIQSKNYKVKSLLLSLLLVALSLITCYYSKDKNMLKLVILILTFKDINFEDFIKKDLTFKFILVLFVILCYFLNFTDNILVYREGILRNSFGFSHPNKLGLYLMMMCMDLFYIKRNKSLVFPNIFSFIICLFIYLFVDSRTNLIVIFLCIVVIFINKFFKNKLIGNKMSEFLSKNLFIFLTILSFVISYKFSFHNHILAKLNHMLSNRLFLNHYFLNTYSLTLLGNDVVTTKYLILDNSYINILLRFGILFLIFMYFNFYSIMKKLYREKNYILIIIFIILLFYGFSESFLYKVSANAFLLYFGKIYNEAK
ncbi:MAG: hypothetical protein HFJ12_04650 [Bacilli bacterium]|nr:hypothetical protein [Bacilli bacterium]